MKKIFTILTLLALSLVFLGCPHKKEDTAKPSTPSEPLPFQVIKSDKDSTLTIKTMKEEGSSLKGDYELVYKNGTDNYKRTGSYTIERKTLFANLTFSDKVDKLIKNGVAEESPANLPETQFEADNQKLKLTLGTEENTFDFEKTITVPPKKIECKVGDDKLTLEITEETSATEGKAKISGKVTDKPDVDVTFKFLVAGKKITVSESAPANVLTDAETDEAVSKLIKIKGAAGSDYADKEFAFDASYLGVTE